MKFDRRADFIWRERALGQESFWSAPLRTPDEANRFVMLRKSFELAEPVNQALVWATADGRYQLFVNGVRVGRGPARTTLAQGSLDPYDLAPWLQPGRNVVAVLAHAYGRNTAWYELPSWDAGRAFGCGGFFLQGEVVCAGRTICLDTGDSWRYQLGQAWQRDVPSNSLGFSECYDARLADGAWANSDYDDSHWASPEILRLAGRTRTGDVTPFQYLSVRDIPAQQEGPVLAGKPIACYEVNTAVSVDDVQALAAHIGEEVLEPVRDCGFDVASAEVHTTTQRSLSVVYDFGEVVVGHIGFELDGPAGAVLDYYPGEQLQTDGRVLIFDGIPGFEPAIVHRYILRAGRQQFERFEWNGLRYLQLTFRHCTQPLRVRAVTVNQTQYPVQARGSFECSDVQLNDLWAAGARSVRLCMHDAYVDCPSREQRQWMDACLDARFNYAAFGDTQLAARLIRQVAATQRADGLTMMVAPGDFALASFTNIPDFCLYWVMAIDDYQRYADDPSILPEVYPAMARAMQWFERQLNEEDLLTELPLWVFVDWAELDKLGQVTALNAQYVAALRAAARLAQAVGHAVAAQHYLGLAQRVVDAINRLLWDEERGVYVDARRNGQRGTRISQQSNAAVIAWGVAPRQRWARIFDVILDAKRLRLTHGMGMDGKIRTALDEHHDVVMAQPFSCHFLHQALRLDGRYSAIVQSVRRWQQFLDAGETTFAETWQVEAMTSKCHAWAATPTFDLSTDVLGVSPGADGFKQIRIAPQPGELLWARGRYPTPQGDVAVQWRYCDDGRFLLKLNLPANCEALVQLPGDDASVRCGPGEHELLSQGSRQP